MEQTVYEELVRVLSGIPVTAMPYTAGVSSLAMARCHGTEHTEEIDTNTIYSIYSQIVQHRVLKSHKELQLQARELLKRYMLGADVVDILCMEWNSPACVMMRRLLESANELEIHGGRHVTALLRDPEMVMCLGDEMVDRLFTGVLGDGWSANDASKRRRIGFLDRLRCDIERCIACDSVCAPACDVARQKAGEAYEERLYQRLNSCGLSYWKESDLREQGFHKTPDARLRVPIAIQGRVVCWIDSKATFCDEKNHGKWLDDQYRSYINRFGPGLVIYWHGYLQSVRDVEQDVLILDRFPDEEDIVRLPTLEL